MSFCKAESWGIVEEKTGIVQQKKIIRKQILTMRDNITVKDKAAYDTAIQNHVLTSTVYRDAQVILAYADYRSEVATTTLIGRALADGKVVFAPKVNGNEMEFFHISSTEDLLKGYCGIPEPAAQISFPFWLAQQQAMEKVQDGMCKAETANTMGNTSEFPKLIYHVMMWMPGAVFDRKKHRIGYGMGFYDRYLKRLLDMTEIAGGTDAERKRKFCLTTAAFAYCCQVLEQIPFEAHDVRPDLIITEDGIF